MKPSIGSEIVFGLEVLDGMAYVSTWGRCRIFAINLTSSRMEMVASDIGNDVLFSLALTKSTSNSYCILNLFLKFSHTHLKLDQICEYKYFFLKMFSFLLQLRKREKEQGGMMGGQTGGHGGRTGGRTDGETYRQTDRLPDGRTDGLTNRRMIGQTRGG